MRRKERSFKPCDKLTPEDLADGRLWGFDVGLGESVPGADETWIRPYELARTPRDSDAFFAAATITIASGKRRRGAVTFNFRDGKVELDKGVILLEPRYTYVGRDDDGFVPDHGLPALRRLSRTFAKLFPLTYEAHVGIGRRELAFSGRIALRP